MYTNKKVGGGCLSVSCQVLSTECEVEYAFPWPWAEVQCHNYPVWLEVVWTRYIRFDPRLQMIISTAITPGNIMSGKGFTGSFCHLRLRLECTRLNYSIAASVRKRFVLLRSKSRSVRHRSFVNV